MGKSEKVKEECTQFESLMLRLAKEMIEEHTTTKSKDWFDENYWALGKVN